MARGSLSHCVGPTAASQKPELHKGPWFPGGRSTGRGSSWLSPEGACHPDRKRRSSALYTREPGVRVSRATGLPPPSPNPQSPEAGVNTPAVRGHFVREAVMHGVPAGSIGDGLGRKPSSEPPGSVTGRCARRRPAEFSRRAHDVRPH